MTLSPYALVIISHYYFFTFKSEKENGCKESRLCNYSASLSVTWAGRGSTECTLL